MVGGISLKEEPISSMSKELVKDTKTKKGNSSMSEAQAICVESRLLW